MCNELPDTYMDCIGYSFDPKFILVFLGHSDTVLESGWFFG
jgi:hypothetical protein